MKKTLAVALLTTIAASPAFAAEGFYVGGTLGSARISNFGATPLTKSSDTVYGGLLGYQINQNFGVEASFTGIGRFNTALISGKGDAFTIAAIGMLPVANGFSLYGKLGMASSKTKVSDPTLTVQGASRTAATYGIGVQYAATPNIGVRFGIDRYGAAVKSNTGVNTNFNSNVWAAGVTYAF
ncbi:MAG: porin family protein [Burkholderiales bacterium]|nr:porin family protein [Burkholderiales bacterium]